MRTIAMLSAIMLLTISAIAQTSGNNLRQKYRKAVYTDSAGTALPYRILEPDGAREGSVQEKYPVILFLHGAGERGCDNEANLSYIDKVFASSSFQQKHPCYVIVPQCAEGYRWCETDWTLPCHTMPATISKYLAAASQLLDSIAQLPSADTLRLYVTGMSMGGFGTWDILSRYPGRFAAAMPICGGADESQACRLIDTPIRAFHGSADRLVKVSRSRNIVRAIRECNGTMIEYTEFTGMGHLVWDKVYSDSANLEWLMSNTRK